jgi:hypothetical protein
VREGLGRPEIRDWRREWDSNPRYGFPHTRVPGVRLQPLGHLSVSATETGPTTCRISPNSSRISAKAVWTKWSVQTNAAARTIAKRSPRATTHVPLAIQTRTDRPTTVWLDAFLAVIDGARPANEIEAMIACPTGGRKFCPILANGAPVGVVTLCAAALACAFRGR